MLEVVWEMGGREKVGREGLSEIGGQSDFSGLGFQMDASLVAGDVPCEGFSSFTGLFSR